MTLLPITAQGLGMSMEVAGALAHIGIQIGITEVSEVQGLLRDIVAEPPVLEEVLVTTQHVHNESRGPCCSFAAFASRSSFFHALESPHPDSFYSLL